MIEQKKGHIVTMAGMGGMNGLKKLVAYCSSKFATIGFNESLRMELTVVYTLFNAINLSYQKREILIFTGT